MLFRYFDYLPDEEAIAVLYNALSEGNLTTLQVKRINAIITSSNFIDYSKAINFLNSNIHARRIALKIFSLDKDWYSKEDIAILKSLEGDALANFFPEIVQVENYPDHCAHAFHSQGGCPFLLQALAILPVPVTRGKTIAAPSRP